MKEKKTALVVAACLFMEMLDGTIITTATPAIANFFQVPVEKTSMLITAYMVALAVFIPLSGWLAQKYSEKKLFMFAILIFTLSSLGCALSFNYSMLVIMRIIQGIGGSMMVPVGRSIVLAKSKKENLLQIISYLVWPGLIAPAIAPLVGGLIVTYFSWHWIFSINIPIGIFCLFISNRIIQENNTTSNAKFDYLGFILASLGAGGLVYSADILSDPGKSWSLGILLFIFFAFIFLISLFYLSRARNPLISLKSLKIKTFRISQTGGSFFWFSVGSAPYLMTLLFQIKFGWTAAHAGSIVLFIFVGNIGIKPASTAIINRFGFKNVLIGSMLLVTITMIITSFFNINNLISWIIFITILSGIGRSLTFTAYNTLSFSELNEEETKSANTLSSTTQNMAQGVGIAISSIALRITHNNFTIAFLLLALYSFLALLEVTTLPKDAGFKALSHRRY